MSFAGTFSVGFTGVKSLTVKSSTGSNADSPVFLSVTVTLPLSSTVTSLSGLASSLLASLTLFTNSAISVGVKCSGSGTTSGNGSLTLNSIAGAPLALVSLPGIIISLVPSVGSLPSS